MVGTAPVVTGSAEFPVFVNRDLVEPDTIIDEERIVGRDEQLESVVSFLKPTLQGNRPPNMLLYGPAGTGKSLIIGAVTQQIIELCQSKGERFGVVDINCQPINTLDQAVYELVQTVAKDVDAEIGVPETGVSTKRKYRRLYELINEYYDSVIFILDEIDLLVGRRTNDEPAYSKLLYQLSRASNMNEIEGRVSVAALTNDPKFMEDIDGRAESSFNPRDVYFPDYDATQLREILANRRDAFRPDALEDDVIPLVAAFAAQSHGDARKAIDLFRGAGDLADERGDEGVHEDHVRESQEEIDKDRSLKLVEGLTTKKKNLAVRHRCCCLLLESPDQFRSESSRVQSVSVGDRRDRCRSDDAGNLRQVCQGTLHVWPDIDVPKELRTRWRDVHGVYVYWRSRSDDEPNHR